MIGLIALALLRLGNKQFGVSNNLRHLCAALAPGKSEYLRYDWKRIGGWNLTFLAGILTGGFLAARFLPGGPPAISQAAHDALQSLGVRDFDHLAPNDVFAWWRLLRWKGIGIMLGGGFLVGFGSAWAGGCTSGHGVLGLANLDKASMLAIAGFFAGGLLATYLFLPTLLR